MKLTCIGIGSNTGYFLEEPAKSLLDEGYIISLTCSNYRDLDNDAVLNAKILTAAGESDAVVIMVHGDTSYYKHFDDLLEILNKKRKCTLLCCNSDQEVTSKYRYLFNGSEEEYLMMLSYVSIGGEENYHSLLTALLNKFDNAKLSLSPPIVPLAQGAYVSGGSCESIEEGIAKLDITKPKVCVFMHQSFWLNHNATAVDYLIKSLEEQGASVVTIFTSTYPNERTGAIGIENIIEDYLIKDKKSIVDCAIITMGFSQTMNPKPADCLQEGKTFFEKLDVPVLQAIALYGSKEKWQESPLGLDSSELAGAVVSPEFDGQIITVPFAAYKADASGRKKYVPLEDRCHMIAETAVLWSMLRKKTNCEKKVAVLLYMYPPRADLAGSASGLDTMESTAQLLQAMSNEGYKLEWVPADGKELVKRLFEGITNDNSWLSDNQILDRAADTVSKETYDVWFSSLDELCQNRLIEGWGKPPGDLHTVNDKLIIPGIINGCVFIGFQPDRGKTNGDAYHDPDNSPPHQYAAFYHWLKHVFYADAVIHMGTHGSLEWLPGKSAGLSSSCFPDAMLCNIPNIYPYIIDNPGEGMQAKRRSYAAVVDHMIPAMTRADGYDELYELEATVQAYMEAEAQGQNNKLPLIKENLNDLIRKMNIQTDLGLADDFTEISDVDRLYDYILEIKDALICDGLHILGKSPLDERLVECIYSLTRNANGKVPSLRSAIANSRGLDINALVSSPSSRTNGVLNGQLLDEIDKDTFELLRHMAAEDFHSSRCLESAKTSEMEEIIEFICSFLYPAIQNTKDEITNVLHALSGGFVPSGPSGCPTRGRAYILPTGKNFYSLDPDGIPWHSSWEIGKQMAEDMIEKYAQNKGCFPKSIGVVVWATDTMRTGGDDISYVLWLMGLRPVWTGYGGRIKDLEVVPLSELKRPRIDVTLRISGLFRDAFPNLVDMIDQGVQTISSLDEDDESNFLAANMRRDMLELMIEGMPQDQAKMEASMRIFSTAPGQYGCGVNSLIMNGRWKNTSDLGEEYVRYGSYAYGKNLVGYQCPRMFRKRLGDMDVTVKNHSNREVDLFDMDDDYDFLGGMNAAVSSIKGEKPLSIMGDSSDTEHLRIRSLEEECRFVFRSKINNPKWLAGLKHHGFKGAQELSQLLDYMIGWDATSDVLDDWMYDDVTKNFLLDAETREWIKDENPYALTAMLERLQEAIERGFWNPNDDMKNKLKELYLEAEERLEEITDM